MIPVRSHHLKAMAESPAHCKASMDGEERDPSKAMDRGTAVHAIVTGSRRVVARPAGMKKPTAAQRNAKKNTPASAAAIEAYDLFTAEHASSLIVSAAEYEQANRMAEAVRREPTAQPYLTGICEQTILWEYMGRAAQCTPDIVAPDYSWCNDLKTTRSANPKWFPYQARKLGYMLTAAYYQTAIHSVHGVLPEMIITAVEATYPHPVVVYRVNIHALAIGEQWIRAQFERLLTCERSNQWPGYAQCVVELDMPDDEIELDFGDDEPAEEQDAEAA